MELLTLILLIIIVLLIFLLLKKERVFGIQTEFQDKKAQIQVIDNKDYRKNIYELLNYTPEGILILDKTKKIIFSNNSAKKWFQIKLNENISGFLRSPDLINSIDQAFNAEKSNDLEIEIRNPSVVRLNLSLIHI